MKLQFVSTKFYFHQFCTRQRTTVPKKFPRTHENEPQKNTLAFVIRNNSSKRIGRWLLEIAIVYVRLFLCVESTFFLPNSYWNKRIRLFYPMLLIIGTVTFINVLFVSRAVIGYHSLNTVSNRIIPLTEIKSSIPFGCWLTHLYHNHTFAYTTNAHIVFVKHRCHIRPTDLWIFRQEETIH